MRLTKEDMRQITEALNPKDYLADIKEYKPIQKESVTFGISEGQYFVTKTCDENSHKRMSRKFSEFAGFIGEATNNYEEAIENATNVNDVFSEKSGFTIEKLKDEILKLTEGNLRSIAFSFYDDSLLVEYKTLSEQDMIYLKEDMEDVLENSEWALTKINLDGMTIKRDIFNNELSWKTDISLNCKY